MKNLTSAVVGLCLGVAVIGMQAKPAKAVLLSVNDPDFGSDSVTRDTATGLEWLDVNESQGLSYNFVAGQFGALGQFAGWRHGTAAEVTTLFTNGGFAPPFSSPTIIQGMIDLIHQLGETTEFSSNTFGPEFSHEIQGLILDINGSPASSAFLGVSSILIPGIPSPLDLSQSIVQEIGLSPEEAALNTGHWLVRTTSVSEPAAVSLTGLGLLALGALRRRRRRTG